MRKVSPGDKAIILSKNAVRLIGGNAAIDTVFGASKSRKAKPSARVYVLARQQILDRRDRELAKFFRGG